MLGLLELPSLLHAGSWSWSLPSRSSPAKWTFIPNLYWGSRDWTLLSQSSQNRVPLRSATLITWEMTPQASPTSAGLCYRLVAWNWKELFKDSGSKFLEMVKDREAWCAAVHEVTKSHMTERLSNKFKDCLKKARNWKHPRTPALSFKRLSFSLFFPYGAEKIALGVCALIPWPRKVELPSG